MANYKMSYFKGMSYDQIRPIFEGEYMKVQTLFKKNTDVEMTKKKRVAEEALLQESFKKLRTTQVLGSKAFQERSTEETKEFSEEDLKTLLEIVPVEEFRVEALQTKYPIIDWEIHTEDSRKYWKIIRVSNITEAYQSFEDMLKAFDREDLDTLWSLVKEKFRSVEPTEDMERALWVELKRLYEPDKEDTLWKLQRYTHDPLTWRLYGSCAVHHYLQQEGLRFIMDYPNITMEEYIRFEEEKDQRHGRMYNWQTATYGKVKYCEDEDDCFTNFETEFPAIVFDDTLTSDAALSCEPSVSHLVGNTKSVGHFQVVTGVDWTGHVEYKQDNFALMAYNYSDSDTKVQILCMNTHESVPEPVVFEPKVVSQPKVWSYAPIIKKYESDSDDEYLIQPSKEQEKPSFAFVNIVKHVKTPRETVKEQNTYSPSPKADKRDFFSHLIRDCDFHEKRMAKHVELNKRKGKGTGQGENKPVWNNVQRLNHQNKFVPKAVLTKTGIFPVNTVRQNLYSQAATTSTARKVNTARAIINKIRPRNIFYKSHSPIRRPFNRIIAPKAIFSNQKVNTTKVKAVSAVGGKRETAIKPSADNPERALKSKGIVDSGFSRHITGNKAYLVEYQDYNDGPVAFGGSKGYIIGKGKIKTRKLDFEDVCFVKELQHFNLFSVSQMCDKKNKVLFTDTECLVLSSDFKLPDENQVLLRIPRQNNMYSFNLENIVPSGGLACLITKATVGESNKWHRRLGHVDYLHQALYYRILLRYLYGSDTHLHEVRVSTISKDSPNKLPIPQPGGGDGGGVGDDGGDGLRLWLPDGEGRRRVEESEVSGWLDRLTRSILEVAGKIPPEKFSGGGAVVAAVAGGGGRPPIEKDETSDDSEVDDNFPRETLMEINTKNNPWFADFANYLVSDIIPKGMRFASIMENSSKGVPSAGPTTASLAEGEKKTNLTTKDADTTNLHTELVDLLGIDIVTQEVVQACPDRKEKGWKTIYGLIKTKIEYLDQTKEELKIDFNKPLKEQNPLNELNDLADKKRKRNGDLKDYSKSTKKHKSSV
ncbi:hypothetical protein Tco_0801468 [Tanacetum coccineum]|uniref:Retrovirus-related Pol polyprotein from transposon TNT 1-94-like beta-barrel domain-containing protein n=1 Tax=Tanacetum coccineum TaxID=301880 RepID=A0ABQ4ZW15_9ASTR